MPTKNYAFDTSSLKNPKLSLPEEIDEIATQLNFIQTCVCHALQSREIEPTSREMYGYYLVMESIVERLDKIYDGIKEEN